jgi:hypothetical protein
MPFNMQHLRLLTKSEFITLAALSLVLAHEFDLLSFIMAFLAGPAVGNVKILLAALSIMLSVQADSLKLQAFRELPIYAAYHAATIIDALREMVNASHVIPMLAVNSIRILCTLPSFLDALVSPAFFDAHDVSPEIVPAVRFLMKVFVTVVIFHHAAVVIRLSFKFWYLLVGLGLVLLISMMFQLDTTNV